MMTTGDDGGCGMGALESSRVLNSRKLSSGHNGFCTPRC